jgi:DNA-binding SARP family transcriptional activator
VEFRVLGPLEVRTDDGRPLAITRPRQRALLCVLLLHASQPVPAGQLIDLLWDSAPPQTAAGTLRTHVWAVRRLLGAGAARLRTLPAAYQLQVAPDELDLLEFTRLSSEGRQALAGGDFATAAERLDRALRLWRGAPLSDLPAAPALSAEVARLEEERLAAQESLLEARLTLGQHHGVAGEIRALVTANPLRERLWALLITALYRAGRQADALAAYAQVREVLVREIGVEPGAELQRLQRRVLAADPDLDAPQATAATTPPRPATPRQLPADIATFTGRGEELKRLGVLLDAHDEPAGPVVISAIDGMGGIGKSALAIHTAHQLADRFPDGQLYLDLQGSTPGLAPLEPLEALGRMLRALGLGPDAIPRELDEAAGRFRSLAAERRLLVLLDNAHGAEQVRPLLPASPGCGVVITSRRVLATLEGAHPLHLDVLPHDKALELLSRLAGPERVRAEPGAAAEVVEDCGFLPLAIRIAGARLAARPTWPISELAGRLADATQRLEELAAGELELRASFEVSLRTLRESPHPADRAAAQAFGLLSLPDGPDLDATGAARLLDRAELPTQRLLERLVDAQLLETPRPGRYRFHDLLRLYAREHAAAHHPEAERLAALRRLFGFYTATAWRTLELLRPGDQRLVTADPRWTDGGSPLADASAALAWLEAERVSLLGAIAQIGRMAPSVPAELACQLARALYGFFLIHNYWGDGVQANQTALELARRNGDRAAQAYAHTDLGSVYVWLGRH